MLALAVTFLAALYLLGPDLLSRTVIGLIAPRKSAPSNRGEEITRAVLWAVLPLAFAILWVRQRGVLLMWGRWSAVDNLYVCLSGTCSAQDRAHIWDSLRAFTGMNFSLLWREYLLVILEAGCFSGLIVNYGSLRRRLKRRRYRELLAVLITPQIADWHVLLSDMLLPEPDLSLVADVLTRNGTLYQGSIGDKTLNSDGSLQTLTLVAPRRFVRDDFKKAVEADPKIDREKYWHSIPGNLFVILGVDIVNMNILYVRKTTKPPSGAVNPAEKMQIQKITNRIELDLGG
jgi:hypothetical protein